MDDIRTIGDNSRHFLDTPQHAAEPPDQVIIGKEDLLDPGMITEQLDDDYGHHKLKAQELLAATLRLFARCADVPIVGEWPEAPPAAADALVLLITAGEDPQLLGANKELAWAKATTNLATTIRTLSGRGAAIADDETASKVTTFVRQIKDNVKPIEETRKTEKRPFDAASAAVQAWFMAILEPMNASATAIEANLLTPWVRKKAAAEAERLRAEAQRAREAAEAALAEAQQNMGDVDVLDRAIEVGEDADRAAARAEAPVKDLGRTRGAKGGVTAASQRWTFRVVDRDQIPKDYWILDEAALANVARNMKDKANVPGVQFFPEISAKVR